mmetsp:Transcript_35617/g.62968  ORF Transcript_35617/g.62968 Transcript_35617/m.62968 type:complete len:406 (+) Transcript_35617:119-1336(+)
MDSGWNAEVLEKELQSVIRDGILPDLEEVDLQKLTDPKSIAPWGHLPIKLYKSATVTRVLSALLDNRVPGTPATYNQILSAVMQQTHVEGYCYLIGGQVRDILKGKISKDVDFNYACTATDVARVCIDNEWTVKYKAIGPVDKPNYVQIGDEQSDLYMEGFSISFNATSECFKQDFRQNMLFYDLTNHVILDKSGYGIADIQNSELRLSCAPANNFEDWAGADMTLGQKALRYVKFVVRAALRQKPLKVNSEESQFVAKLLKRALRENGAALKGFWFGYVLGECLKTQEGVQALHTWVCEQGEAAWWEDWLPFVQPTVKDPTWLSSLAPGAGDESDLKMVKQVFQVCYDSGNGIITQSDMEKVLRRLDAKLTDKDFEVLFSRTRPVSPGNFRYDDFIDSLVSTPG